MRRFLSFFFFLIVLCVPVEATSPAVALTFDDGPSGRFTERLLDGLQERQVNATFFLCGYRLEQYPNLAKRMVDEGHEIGLHGYTHHDMASMGQAQLSQELSDTMALLPDNANIHLLRPPGGKTTDRVAQAAANCGVAIITWSVDPKDWATKDSQTVTKAVVDRAQDGDIILLHDMSDSSVDAALAIVDLLRQQGYTFCTVSQLALRQGKELSPGSCYSRLSP